MRPGTPGFISERLVEARESRAMTALSLADIVGVTRAAISQYENGHQSPSPEVLRRISNALNVPVHRFTHPVQPRDAGPIFNRCMNSATKRARDRARRKYEWLREICQYLQRFVKFRQPNFPSFGLPADPAQISFDLVEEIASETRKYYRLGSEPVGNIVGLLENQGAIVSRFDLEAATLDALSEWGPGDTRPYIILSSGKDSAVRSRFDAAHELGHMLLHRHIDKTIVCQSNSFSLIESQAHRFASAFLLPANAFGESMYAPTLDAFRSMKARWHVAISAMIMRASDLQLINDDHAKNLWINLTRRKWRTREPLDDKLEVEQPQFLRRCIELLLQRQMIGAGDITAQLGVPASDIEQLTGARPATLDSKNVPVELLGENHTDDLPDDDEPKVIPFRKAQ